jgi:hypothetical protein
MARRSTGGAPRALGLGGPKDPKSALRQVKLAILVWLRPEAWCWTFAGNPPEIEFEKASADVSACPAGFQNFALANPAFGGSPAPRLSGILGARPIDHIGHQQNPKIPSGG